MYYGDINGREHIPHSMEDSKEEEGSEKAVHLMALWKRYRGGFQGREHSHSQGATGESRKGVQSKGTGGR